MSTNKQPLTIGRLAKAADVNIETIRHYQRQNLIKEPRKPESGFRHYPNETIDRIRFIKRAQQLGFTLKNIRQLIELGSEQCGDIQVLARAKHETIQQQIKGLMTIQSALEDIIASCQIDDIEKRCALIEALSKKGFLKD